MEKTYLFECCGIKEFIDFDDEYGVNDNEYFIKSFTITNNEIKISFKNDVLYNTIIVDIGGCEKLILNKKDNNIYKNSIENNFIINIYNKFIGKMVEVKIKGEEK